MTSQPYPPHRDLTVMIDNYDSFTYNIVQYLQQLGTDVVTLRNDQTNIQHLEALKPNRLVISPGPGTPADAGISCEAIKHFAGRIPILGVCLGHQAIVEVFGGRVIRHTHIMHGKTSQIRHDGLGVYKRLPNAFNATRYHSLVGDVTMLPACLKITSHCFETERANNQTAVQFKEMQQREKMNGVNGERTMSAPQTLQGVRHVEYTIEGVQFHPESIGTEFGMEMLTNFLQWKGGKWTEQQ